MGYWNHHDLVLGDAPADRITAAWRRIRSERRRTSAPLPTVHEALSALTDALLACAIWPKAVATAVPPALPPHELVDLTALTAEWGGAIGELEAVYVRDVGRRPTAHEVVATFEFVVRPEPASFFVDGATLTGSWSFDAEVVAGPIADDFSSVFVGVSATAASRLLIEGAGGRVLEHAVHESLVEAAHWAQRLVDLDPTAEALTFCETEALGDSPPNTILIRRGRVATSFEHEHVRRWSERLGSWCLAALVHPRPRVVGGFLGASLGADAFPTVGDAKAALNQLSDTLGFATSDLMTGFGVQHIETWIVRAMPPLGAPPPLRAPMWLGAIASDPSRTRSVLGTLSPPDDWQMLDMSTDDRVASFTVLRGTPDAVTWAALTTELDGWALSVTCDGDGAAQTAAYQCGGATHQGTVRGPSAFVAAFGDLTVMVGEAPGEIRWPPSRRGESAADRRPPGLFELLVQDGLVHPDDVARVQSALPPDAVDHPHGSERLDSTRWPCERDARLAAWAAQWLPDPQGIVAELLLALPRAGRDVRALKALVDTARNHCDDALLDDDADPALAMAVQELAEAHLAAAHGLDAYHVHRRLPGLAATHAAGVVRLALERDLIDTDALIEAAIAAIPPILDPPVWFWSLIDDARGVADVLRPHLESLPATQLAAFHAYQRDLATRLTGDPWLAHLPEDCSDETAFEAAAWVVTQGRQWYRAVAQDPALMPTDARPGTRAARAILGLAAEVWDDRFESEPFPSDYAISWGADGSVA